MVRVITVFLCFIVAAAPVAETPLPQSKPEDVGMSSERLMRLQVSLQELIDGEMLSGTVTLVARNGRIVFLESQGYRRIDTNDEMTDDTIFYIMSMTKPIVSIALMMLYEEGHFLLDDPITDWIPELKGKKVIDGSERVTAKRSVTFRHVLTHTSGLDPSTGKLTDEEKELLRRKETLEETILNRAPLPLNFQPGERWQYGSSTDYVALLVERISGQRLDEFLQERIFDPLGMLDTHYYVPESKIARVAAVYRPDAKNDHRIELARAPEFREPGTYFGGTAGLYSTAGDYFRFHQMMLNGGGLNGVRLLSPKTVDLIISSHIEDELSVYPGYNFGLGYSIVTDPGKAEEPLTPGSFGWGGAWGTYFWVDPAERMQAIVMTQITGYRHLKFRSMLSVLATQAVTESYRHLPPDVMGYEAK